MFIQSPTYEGSSIFTEHRDIYSLYIENKTTNKNNHLFYSSKKEETNREICIFTSFSSNNKAYYIVHCTYSLSHSLRILLDVISVKIQQYWHLSRPNWTCLLKAELHTELDLVAWFHSCWMQMVHVATEMINSNIQSKISWNLLGQRRQHGCHLKVQSSNSVWLGLQVKERKKKKTNDIFYLS